MTMTIRAMTSGLVAPPSCLALPSGIGIKSPLKSQISYLQIWRASRAEVLQLGIVPKHRSETSRPSVALLRIAALAVRLHSQRQHPCPQLPWVFSSSGSQTQRANDCLNLPLCDT